MGYKTRGNYLVHICVKACANKDIKCKDCLRGSNYAPVDSPLNNGIKIKTPYEKDFKNIL